MATITRGTKASAGGGTAFVTGTTILPDEVNTDFDTVYAAFNAGANLAAGADIDPLAIGDLSATAGAHDDTISPGSSASHTLPNDLVEEIQQLRYAVERLALGVGAQRVDTATGTAFWGDLPVRGHNLVRNSNFSLDESTADPTVPVGWGTALTPTLSFLPLTGADLSEGSGQQIVVQNSGAANEGITYIFFDPKPSTRYLVIARAKATSGTARLLTTGADATSFFRDISDTTTSSTYVTLKGVIQSDSSATDIEISLVGVGATDNVSFAYAGLFECGTDFVQINGTEWDIDSSVTDVTVSNIAFTNLGVDRTIVVPSSGMSIEVYAEIPLRRLSTNGVVGIQLFDGAESVAYSETNLTEAGDVKHVSMYYTVPAIPGTSHAFTLLARASAANVATVAGASIITAGNGGGVNESGNMEVVLGVRLVRSSG